MRLWTLALLIGCSGEQGFGENKDVPSGSGGEGVIEVAPAEIVFDETTIGHSENAPFKIISKGEDPLRVTDVRIIDAGEMSDVAVFHDLRAFTPVVLPFELETDEEAEWLVTATLPEAGSITGMIEIRCNDTSVSDPSPGVIRIPMSASARDEGPGTGPDDTGVERPPDPPGPEDTGSTDDTGA
jgi:hypothetical protein